MKCKENKKCVQTVVFNLIAYFEISVFEIWEVDYLKEPSYV